MNICRFFEPYLRTVLANTLLVLFINSLQVKNLLVSLTLFFRQYSSQIRFKKLADIHQINAQVKNLPVFLTLFFRQYSSHISRVQKTTDIHRINKVHK